MPKSSSAFPRGWRVLPTTTNDAGGFDGVYVPTDAAIQAAPGTARALLADLETLCEPELDTPMTIGKQLVLTRQACPTSRGDTAPDLQALTMAFQEALEGLPSDVIVAAFRDHRRTEKWFPAVADIVSRAERAMRPRRRAAAHLRKRLKVLALT